jgi:hypothetical protein
VTAVCKTLGIDPPAPAAGNEADMRAQAAKLLQDVPKEKLAGLLDLLRR